MSNFRVRFAVPVLVNSESRPQGAEEVARKPTEQRRNSRFGCLQCKKWRIRCDEGLPVCGRCSRRGIICQPAPRDCQWQVELPGITIGIGTTSAGDTDPLPSSVALRDDKALRHWFHHACFIMVSDESGENPYSYTISSFLSLSQSLLHILRSVSLGHQNYFRNEALSRSLDERQKAISACRRELSSLGQPMHLYFFTVYMLGVSSSYIDRNVSDFGKVHLFGARAIIDTILADEVFRTNSLTPVIFGAFIYWDMGCSLLVDPSEQMPIETPLISSYVCETSHIFNPVTGRLTGMLYLLAILGRYTRATLDGAPRNLRLENTLQTEITAWATDCTNSWWSRTGEAFRWHGLITLYRLSKAAGSGFPSSSNLESTGPQMSDSVRSCALGAISLLLEIPPTLPLISLQILPLLTAGAELTDEDEDMKHQVQMRLEAVYSFNRIPTSLFAAQLLKDVWDCKRLGLDVMWQEVMLSRNWRLRV